MAGAVAATAWWVIYVDGKPTLLSAGNNAEQVEQGIRTMLLGSLGEKTTIVVKSIFDAPPDDVIRIGVIAIMTMLSGLQDFLGSLGGPRRGPRGM